ncbi:hypothetical protein K4V12_11095 [Staphylococcus epidermidis]|nr:hypothetical protein [Staphylococcus epidermidis]
MSLELDDKFDLKGNRLFYLAMSPKFFGVATNHLKHTKISYEEIYDDRFFHSYFL